MTDEQAMREARARQWLDSMFDGHMHEVTNVLALLDAKDAELIARRDENSDAWATATKAQDERAAALSRAEQAEAALAEERKAHQAFRVEVSQLASWVKINLTDLILGDVSSISYPTRFSTRTVERLASNCRKYLPDLSRFILPAKHADPLVEAVADALRSANVNAPGLENVEGLAKAAIEAVRQADAIERAGGTISFERNG